jgi:hypothetical protein
METRTHIDRVPIAPVPILLSLVKAIFPQTAMFLILPKGCLSHLPMMIPDAFTVLRPIPRLLLLPPLESLPYMLHTHLGRQQMDMVP